MVSGSLNPKLLCDSVKATLCQCKEQTTAMEENIVPTKAAAVTEKSTSSLINDELT